MDKEEKLVEVLTKAHCIVILYDNIVGDIPAGAYDVDFVDYEDYRVHVRDEYGETYTIAFDQLNLDDQHIVVYGLVRLNHPTVD